MKGTVKRIAIFVVYDKQGIIDEYCIHIIRELKSVCDKVEVVCNGNMTDKSIEKLQEETVEIYMRKNEGYDAIAYKYALSDIVGWDALEEYDELLLVNDSFYGPFWPLTDIVESMEERNVDFWGLTGQIPMGNTFGDSYPEEILPYHIQTYFVVVHSHMLHDISFRAFWDNITDIKEYTDAVTGFELLFTKYFTEKGFVSGTYVDITFQKNEKIENRTPYIMHYPCELIEKYHCPIVKRKCFTLPYQDILHYSIGQDMNAIFDTIEFASSYDIDMIWKHLIRIMEPGRLHQVLHLRYVLPEQASLAIDYKACYGKTAVIAHINYIELQDECISYLLHLPKEIDVFVTTKSEDIKRNIERKFWDEGRKNISVIIIGNRGREIRGLLIECKDIFLNYKYICYVHDKRTTGGIADAKVGEIFFHSLWNSMLKSRAYIDNILSLLEENKHIGLLAPPAPYHWTYFRYLGQEWTGNYQTTKELANRLRLNCVMQEEFAPFILGTTFWCRTDALRPLFEYGFCEMDFPEEPLALDGTFNHAIERIFQYVAQSQGYASGIVMSDADASPYLQDYHSMIAGVLNEYRKTVRFPYLDEYLLDMDIPEEFIEFCVSYDKVYVYGTGKVAGRVTNWLWSTGVKYEGYIVSNDHRECAEWNGKPVYVLPEIEVDNDKVGIILGLGNKFQKEVAPILKKKGYRNIYLVNRNESNN